MTDTIRASFRVDSCSIPCLSKRSNRVTTISFVTHDSYRQVRPIFWRRDRIKPYLVMFRERVLASPDGLLTLRSNVSMNELTFSFLI